jgi:hypothetical protein
MVAMRVLELSVQEPTRRTKSANVVLAGMVNVDVFPPLELAPTCTLKPLTLAPPVTLPLLDTCEANVTSSTTHTSVMMRALLPLSFRSFRAPWACWFSRRMA